MKAVGMFATILMFAPMAFAQVEGSMAVLDHEQGAVTEEIASALTAVPSLEHAEVFERHGRGGIVGGIIGIIGAIAADHIDRDHRHRDRWVTCYARDRRGHVYRASARNARQAQWRAREKCEDYARYCRSAGCHVHY